jgi:conjugative transfer ATPase
MLNNMKKEFAHKPLTQKEKAKWYKRPPSLSEKLPWMEYDKNTGAFLLDDGRSVAGLLECDDVPSEARPETYLAQLQRALQGVFQDVFPMYFDEESPWIVQFYLQDELSLQPFYDEYLKYIHHHGKVLTEEYKKLMEEHLHYMTKREGMFIDQKVSGLTFRGKRRKIRAVIYRVLHAKSKLRAGTTPVQELNAVMNSFIAKLESAGVKTHRMDAKDFYHWMLPWFNPRPRHGAGSTDTLLKNCPMPTEDIPFGYDFSERLFFSTPESENNLWYFDKLPHKYVSVTGLNYLPEVGHISLERAFGNHYYSLFDKLPEGSVFTMTVVIQHQDIVKNHLDAIEKSTRKALHAGGLMAREDCQTARRAIESGNYLFPTSMGVYLRGEDTMDLYQKETDILTTLSNNGLVVVDCESELFPLDSYLRYLPMNYDFQFDKKYLNRSRYLTGQQLAKLLPLYGRERGTGNPGMVFYNRAGEPLTVDPFNTQDKDNNSHLLILGSTGSGKSALCVYLMMHLMATYRPRLVIVDAGNSFGLLSQYFQTMGLTVNRVEISLNTTTSLNPFAESKKLLTQFDKASDEKIKRLLEATEEELNSLDQEATESEKKEVSENRDYMGEMALSAQLMITGGEAKEEQKISRQDRMLILDALLRAAKAADAQGFDQMLPEDVGNALETMSHESASDPQKASRLREMADGIRVFCKDHVSSQFFNRRGEPWIEADITILEMGLFKEEGYEAQRALAFMGAMNTTMSLAERNQYDERFTVFFGDECHVVTKNPLTAVSVTKCSKMSRKIGLWLWLATQNVEDFPNEARKMLSMIEFWICLGMSEVELKEVERFKVLTEAERQLFRSVRKSAKQYVEGVMLCQRFKGLFRNIPPRLSLALAMTEKHEKAERKAIMNEFNCTEIEAVQKIARRLLGDKA